MKDEWRLSLMKKIMVVFVGLMAALGSFADTWTDSSTGITWTYQVENGEVSLFSGRYTGSYTHAVIPTSTTGDLVIPATIAGKRVTSIGDYAFHWCRGLTSVAIPEGVTSIGYYAFEYCSGLTSVTIPEGVTSINDYAFKYCSGLTSVTIPDGVTSIGCGAFYGCSGLTSATIPEGVTSIGNSAFCGCNGLTSVTIPSSVTSIGSYAFDGCGGLTSVTIPEDVTSIGNDAFRDCSGLTSVTFLCAPPSNISDSGLIDTKRGYYFSRQYGGPWINVIGGVSTFRGYASSLPSATIISSNIRENDPTIMDVVYKVTSKKSTVKVRVLAFEDGERSFSKVVRPETFVTDTNGVETACNVGDNVTPNVEHTISWRVSSDWTTKLAKVKFEVLVCEGELLPLELMTIPASDQYGKMKVSWNRISGYTLFDAILWLYADHDPELTLSDGILKWNDVIVARDSRIEGRYIGGGGGYDYTDVYTYVFGKMGYLFANYNILKYINQETRLGLSMSYGGGPGNARYYAYKIVEE